MTFEQITALLDRGFTPDQITLLTTSAVAPTPAADTAPETSPVLPLPDEQTGATVETQAEPKPESVTQETEPAPAAENNTEVLNAIQDLKKTIQANNILTRSMDTVDPDQALEKAMAEFIRPSFDKHE